jgi:hypothetical protein
MRVTRVHGAGMCVIAWIVASACSSTENAPPPGPNDGLDATANDDGGTGDEGLGDEEMGSDSSASACPTHSPIYIVDDSGYFVRSVDPSTLAVTELHLPQCTQPLVDFYSPIAVTHDAHSWFMSYQSGGRPIQWFLLPLETTDGGCPNQRFERPQSADPITSMTYVSTAPGSAAETLFAVSSPDAQSFSLSKLSEISGSVTPVASLPTAMWIAGTADGRMFGVRNPAGTVSSGPYTVSVIDPSTGAAQQIGTVPGTGPVAFARGAVFVFATAPGGARGTTDVYSFDPESKTATKRGHFDFAMGGAGASTCAAPKGA